MIADLFSVSKTTFFIIRKQQTLNFSYHESSRWQFSSENQWGLKAFRTDNLPKRSVGCPWSLLTKRSFLNCLGPRFQYESSCKTLHMKAEHIFIWMVSHEDSFWNRGKRQLGNGLLLQSRKKVLSLRFIRSAPLTKNTQALGMSAFADSGTISYEDHEETNSPEDFNWSSDELCYVKGLASSVTPSSIIDSIRVLPLIILVVATR